MDDIKEYLNSNWNIDCSGQHDDIQAFWNEDYIELVCLRLVDAGCFEHAETNLEKRILALADSIGRTTELKLIDQALAEYSTKSCKVCGQVIFLNDQEEIENIDCPGCDNHNFSEIKPWFKRAQEIDKIMDARNFRDYIFLRSDLFGKANIGNSINILDPTESDIDDSLGRFTKDGFSTIVIFID